MKARNVILSSLLTFLFFACDSTIQTTVEFGTDLSDQNYSLIDWDFAIAGTEGTDHLHFEFITDQELTLGTEVKFYGQSGGMIAVVQVDSAANLPVGYGEVRSFSYSIALQDIRAKSLIHEVIIGN